MRMCACRGTAGFAHVSCLAEQAKLRVAAVLGGGTPPRSLAKLRAELKRLREESRAAAAEHERSLAEVSRLEAQIEAHRGGRAASQ